MMWIWCVFASPGLDQNDSHQNTWACPANALIKLFAPLLSTWSLSLICLWLYRFALLNDVSCWFGGGHDILGQLDLAILTMSDHISFSWPWKGHPHLILSLVHKGSDHFHEAIFKLLWLAAFAMKFTWIFISDCWLSY